MLSCLFLLLYMHDQLNVNIIILRATALPICTKVRSGFPQDGVVHRFQAKAYSVEGEKWVLLCLNWDLKCLNVMHSEGKFSGLKKPITNNPSLK